MKTSLHATTVTASILFVASMFACGDQHTDNESSTQHGVDDGGRTRDEPTLDGVDAGNAGGGDSGKAELDGGDCEPSFTGVVRDFKDSHPDFEHFTAGKGELGIVKALLGPDSKPVYDNSRKQASVSSKESFDEWFRDVPSKNVSVPFVLPMVKQSNGSYVFDDQSFFPIDDKGFGNQGRPHNFHYTFELHSEFVYRGGEYFKFTFDDDLFVFFDGKLFIGMGGVHKTESGTISIDTLANAIGLKKGNKYPLDIFRAERHTSTGSQFAIETTLSFTNCTPILK